jgi:hypothetical protein
MTRKTKNSRAKKPDWQKRKDAAKRDKALRQNPQLPKIMLEQAFKPDGIRTKLGLKGLVDRMDGQKSFSGTVLLKWLVGNGFVRPEGKGYSITKKGLKLAFGKTEKAIEKTVEINATRLPVASVDAVLDRVLPCTKQ